MASIEQSSLFTSNDLNKRVTILKPVATVLDDGTRTLAYTNVGKRWCNISIVNISTNANDKTVERKTSYRVVMRDGANLADAEGRLIYKGVILYISAPPIKLANGMVLMDCFEVKENDGDNG